MRSPLRDVKTFHIEYSWKAADKDFGVGSGVEVYATLATDIISAMNKFHRYCQKESSPSKPVFRPDDYKIKALYQLYHAAGFERDPIKTPIIRSDFDLPRGKNPDLDKPVFDPNQSEWDFSKV